MFDGLNNNRAHWNELAEVYNAKMKAIEDEKKKLEEEENRKCKKLNMNIWLVGVVECRERHAAHLILFYFLSWRWREIKNLHHLLGSFAPSSAAEIPPGRASLRLLPRPRLGGAQL